MKEKPDNTYFYVILVVFLVFVLIGVFALVSGKKQSSQFGKNIFDTTKSGSAGEYSDEICKISFKYPKDWTKSNLILPLPQKPLSQATFNEPAKGSLPPKNSILSFICYDAKKYSFDQFMSQSPLSQGQTEVLNVGSTRWQRAGNFIYTTKGDKLLIFEMFFTKYDLKPESGYEKAFLDIVKSIRFF